MEPDRQLDDLQPQATERGWVLTLRDVLFTSGKPELKADAAGNLKKLITFVNTYPDRSVTIEGFTDDSGSGNYNHSMSQRRADAVQSYLIEGGVRPMRLVALGKGDSAPVADNASAAGREQNRRVEVIISNPPAASSDAPTV